VEGKKERGKGKLRKGKDKEKNSNYAVIYSDCSVRPYISCFNNNSGALILQRIIPTELPLLVGEVPTLADRGCRVVSATNPQEGRMGIA
jgi:hypothetical protein